MNATQRRGQALVVIADDLTGATDAGLQFTKCGARTTVWIDTPSALDGADVNVIDLDSRAIAADVAAERMRTALEALPSGVTVVKKIDSTLRGNIAAELAALLRAQPGKTAIVVPAYPKNGRIQRDGLLFVHGTPVHETDFGRDLLAPVRSCRILDFLPPGTSAVVSSAASIPAAIAAGVRAVAVDAERDEDLAALAQLAGDERFVWVGSAGFLEFLAPALVGSGPPAAPATAPDVRQPILFVIGSLSETTRQQMTQFAHGGGLTEIVDPRTILIDEGRGRAEIVAERIRETVAAGNDLLVALSSDRSDVEAALALGRAHGYDAQTTSLELRERFVALVQRAVPLAGAVVLSGADVARSFCVTAGVRGMRLLREAAPGIPLSRALGRDFLLVPKAGGSGTVDAYRDIVHSVRGTLARLDPQAQRFLADLKAAAAPPLSSVSPQVARAMHASLVKHLAGPIVPVDDVRERAVPGPAGPILIRIYTPNAGARAPLLVYFHGGGFVVGDLAMPDEVCRSIANEAGCIVVSVDYRLAPEHPYPGPVNDAFAATQWVAERAAELGGDPDRIAVGGDSAGGNLAAVVCLMARDRGGPAIGFQVLVYPAVDPSSDHPSLRDYGTDHYLTLEEMAWFGRHHVNHDGRRDDPYLWPIVAPSLRGLPPALVITAEADPLRDGAERYAQRLQNEGVPTRLIRYDGMLHGFFLYPSVFDRGREAVREAAAALRGAFAPTPLI